MGEERLTGDDGEEVKVRFLSVFVVVVADDDNDDKFVRLNFEGVLRMDIDDDAAKAEGEGEEEIRFASLSMFEIADLRNDDDVDDVGENFLAEELEFDSFSCREDRCSDFPITFS